MTRVFPRPPPSAPSRTWPGAAEARNPPLPPYAGELRDRLTEAIAGEVGFGGGDRAMYAYDASVYRQVPVGVVTPRDAADVEAALEVCRRFGAPVLARGCGTSLTGQAVNGAVVFDFTRHMDGIVELAPMRHTARVQPGVVCDRLRDAAAPYGLTFGPDPATHDHATIGGMVGNNSCGTHSLTAGKTVDNIEELEIVTYDGTRMRVGATGEDELECVIAAGGRRGAIYAGLRHIRDTYADAIRRGLPVIPRRVSGYNLDALLPENGFHVARALVGSEGTLALTLDATCGLVRLPPRRALVVLGYPDIPSSGDDVPWLLRFGAIGLEFTSGHVVTNLHAKGFRFGGRRPGRRGRGVGDPAPLGGHRPHARRARRPRRLAQLGGRRRPPGRPRALPARFPAPARPARLRRRLLRPLGPGMRPQPHRLRPAQPRRRPCLPAVHGAGRRPRRRVRRIAVGGARGRARAGRAVAAHVPARADAGLRGVQARLGPRRPDEPPQADRPLPPGRAPA